MFDHLLVGEAQDGDALTAEEGVAESITSLSRGVGRAVHLDGQFGFDAKEVGEVVADGELSTELEAVDLSAAQQAPEERFGRGGAVAVPAAEHDLTSKSSLHDGRIDSSIFSVSRDRHRIARPYRCTMRGIESKQSSMIPRSRTDPARSLLRRRCLQPSPHGETALGVTTRTVRHPALAQNLRYACNPPIHEGSPLTKVRGAGGEKRQHLPLDTEHAHYFSSPLVTLSVPRANDVALCHLELLAHPPRDLRR